MPTLPVTVAAGQVLSSRSPAKKGLPGAGLMVAFQSSLVIQLIRLPSASSTTSLMARPAGAGLLVIHIDGQRVSAGLELFSQLDFIGTVPGVFLRGVFAYLGSVEPEAVLVVGGDDQVGPTRSKLAGQIDGATEEAFSLGDLDCGVAFVGPNPGSICQLQFPGRASRFDGSSVGLGVTKPLRSPEQVRENAHGPGGRLAPLGCVSVLIPDANLPVARLMRLERLAGVGHVRRLIGFDPTTIPEIALAGLECRLARRDKDLVGGLPSALSRVDHLPRETGLQGINPERVGEVLATEVIHPCRCVGGQGGNAKQDQRQEKER